ncbi:hypothetical protein F383_25651 [Gossypium arboreum]|uniref:Uncharacterized protein n=1 Tax=Gossypium arboreum TaxID=29729 RepID=A0A0B0MKB8_GOSAR|nr:hypothetical protein F383_25651 [Gossypium arboreum]
MCCRKGIRPDG